MFDAWKNFNKDYTIREIFITLKSNYKDETQLYKVSDGSSMISGPLMEATGIIWHLANRSSAF